jgi:hypothetical protein
MASHYDDWQVHLDFHGPFQQMDSVESRHAQF